MGETRVAIVGLGLIGGSFATALPAPYAVVGWDGDDATNAAAAADGIAVAPSLADAVRDADLVVVAVPVSAMEATFAALRPIVRSDALVTDTASVKAPIVAAARAAGLVRFVGGHPMAGRETAGYASATGSLFAGARWALCIDAEARIDDVLELARLVHAAGAGVIAVEPAEHDRAVAVVSHLPHVTAAALAARALDDEDAPLLHGLAGGSFRDATRVARSPASFWSAVLRANAAAMGPLLREQAATFARIAEQVEAGDGAALEAFFAHGGESRARFDARTGVAVEVVLSDDDDTARAELLALGRRGGYFTSFASERVLHARIPEGGS